MRDAAETSVSTIAYLVGARPNFPKMAPVVRAMRDRAPEVEHTVIHTGQHYDPNMSDVFAEELDLRWDRYCGVGSGTHAQQTARTLEAVAAALEEIRPVALVAAGDVNSTLAGALAASQLQIPVAHVEAGLRSFDRSMPEEVNRVLVDQLSQWCFIHSPEAAGNLRREGKRSEQITFVGNTMIDSIVALRDRIDASDICGRLGVESGGYLLVTLHRPTLVDGPLLDRVLNELTALSRGLPVVFPVHPRTQNRLRTGDLGRVVLTDPLGYVNFLALESHAAAVLTDSGGVQEETTYLGVPCFTLRDTTERPVTLTHGTNRLLGLRPEAIRKIPSMMGRRDCPRLEGWNGHAAERIADVLGADFGIGLRDVA